MASASLLVAGATALAAPKRITGKLSKPGYTVIALDADGDGSSARAGPRFSLTPPANRITLHLRGRDGVYAGPIVIARERRGKRAIVGVRAGAKLGPITVKRGKGFAKLERSLPAKRIDMTRKARAKRGVPIGSGVFGRVTARPSGAFGPGQDGDLDGLPGALDVDDDGDLIIDNLDPRAAGARAAQAEDEIFDVQTGLSLQLEGTANVNAGSTDSAIEAALPTRGHLLVEVLPGDSPELDCGGSPNPSPPPPLAGGLAYCSVGGTGSVFTPGQPLEPFPQCCDGDGDGFGALTGSAPPGGSTAFMVLQHGATTEDIGTGDVLIQRVVRGGAPVQLSTALQFIFATVPALGAYSDTAGNSAAVSYPVAVGEPGTDDNGFPVAAGPSGDIVVTLAFWRPQRRPIEGETGDWIDIGGLGYQMIAGGVGAAPGGTVVNQPCPQSALATADPSFTAGAAGGAPGFTDQAADQPAAAANVLTFTVNMTECLASLGVAWPVGEQVSFDLPANVARPGAGAGAGAQQTFFFKRQ